MVIGDIFVDEGVLVECVIVVVNVRFEWLGWYGK